MNKIIGLREKTLIKMAQRIAAYARAEGRTPREIRIIIEIECERGSLKLGLPIWLINHYYAMIGFEGLTRMESKQRAREICELAKIDL